MTTTGTTHGTWRLRLRGHELTAEARVSGETTEAVVRADGRAVAVRPVGWFEPDLALADLDLGWDLADLDLAGGALAVRSRRRGTLHTARVVVRTEGRRPEVIGLEPPVGSRARRSWELQERHPRWYAARHVAVAAAQVLLGLVAFSLLWSWIPWGWLPDVSLPELPSLPLPSIPWPSIPWPDWSWPDWELPGWVRAVLESKKYWLPILVAVVVAHRELRKRRQRREDRDA